MRAVLKNQESVFPIHHSLLPQASSVDFHRLADRSCYASWIKSSLKMTCGGAIAISTNHGTRGELRRRWCLKFSSREPIA
ncbi:MAG: hypothetical protein AB1861_13020 [Cyanobacteriota bacterium]